MSLTIPKDGTEKILVKFIFLQILKRAENEVKITLAKKKNYEEAYHLVYEKYKQKGLINITKEEFFKKEGVTQFPYKNKRVVIAKKRGEIIATTTIILSKCEKLPCENTYPLEVEHLTKEGKCIAEFTRLAAKDNNIYTLLRMFRFLFKYSLSLGASDILIEVHPKHAIFYEKFFLFERIGELRSLSELNGAPAYLCRLDLSTIKERMYQQFAHERLGENYCDFFFKKSFPEDEKLEEATTNKEHSNKEQMRPLTYSSAHDKSDKLPVVATPCPLLS